MLLYDLPYRPRPEIPDSVSYPDMTTSPDSIKAKPSIAHQPEKQDTVQFSADSPATASAIEQGDTTTHPIPEYRTQLPEQAPVSPANDTLVSGQILSRPILGTSDSTQQQASGDSSYLPTTDTTTVPRQSFPDVPIQTGTDSIFRADELKQKLSEKVADDTATAVQELSLIHI